MEKKMENEMETGLIYKASELKGGIIGVIVGLCKDNGKENGNYYNGVI